MKKLLLLLTIPLLVLLNLVPVYAALPAITVDLTQVEIPLNSKDPYFVIIPYGDTSIDYQVEGVTMKVTVNKPDLVIDPTNVFDIYNTADTTKVVNCNQENEGNAYPVGQNFLTKNSLLYGPGSAKEGSKGTTISTLTIKRVGCLKIGLLPSKDARSNEIITITSETINANEGESKKNYFFTTDEPPVRTTLLQLGVDKTCSQGQEYVDGRCVQTCPQGFLRGADNNCQKVTIDCGDNEEVVNKECKTRCLATQFRTNFGICKDEEKVQNVLVSTIVTILLAVLLLFSIYTLVRKLSQKST
jgi:hypothetical protein